MNVSQLTASLKQAASELGFALAGACPANEPDGYQRLVQWIESGYAGEMDYMDRRRTAYRHPKSILDGVQSLLMLALPYAAPNRTPDGPGVEQVGQVARYARSSIDYHDVVRAKLRELGDTARRLKPGVRTRGVVDTAPLLEREFAMLAGLGWIGKNTLLIHREQGSWFFLAALLLDCSLQYDAPLMKNYCGSCTACLDACPTGALIAPGVLDARRCISYLTIELRGQVPGELRPKIGDWLFGCDICQEVCPWNRGRSEPWDNTRGGKRNDRTPGVDLESLSLSKLLAMDEAAFRRSFRKSPFWRTRRRGLLRNAAIVLGNQRHGSACAALRRGLKDSDPIVSEACQWALERCGC